MATVNEVNYFFKDENGKIHKVLKARDNNPETQTLTTVPSTAYAASNTSMGAYNQMTTSNQTHCVRVSNYGTYVQPVEITTYATSSNGSIPMAQQHTNSCSSTSSTPKYEMQDDEFNEGMLSSRINKTTNGRTSAKQTPNYNNSSKAKSKVHATIRSPASVQKKRKPDKNGKGLRFFSNKVCEKVKEKGTTTYNEVADELVEEEIRNNYDAGNCDQKNIRRRVYDALNVLMAMQIIAKDKKEIRWIGLPSSSTDQCVELAKEHEERRARINQKHQQLRELLEQHVAFKSLVIRNKEAERQGNIPAPNSSIQLPFIIVNTHKSTRVHCSVANDKSEYIFKFDDKFEMHDDAEVLKRMGFLSGLDSGTCSYEDIERAKKLVPQNFEKYIEAYGNSKGPIEESDDEYTTFTAPDDDDANIVHELDNDDDLISDID